MLDPRFRADDIVVKLVGPLVLVFLYVPLLVVVAASFASSEFFQFPPQDFSFRWFVALVENEDWRRSILFTLSFAAITAIGSTIVGVMAGIGISKLSPPIRKAATALAAAPLIVPTIVLAIAFYQTALKLDIVGSMVGFIVANMLMTTPLVTLLVAAAANGMDPRTEYASASTGAKPLRTLWSVTLPVVLPVAYAAGMLSFLLTLDEVVISSFLVGPGATPVAVKMFFEVQTGATPMVIAMSTVLILVSLTITVALVAFNKLGAVTRTN